MRLFMTGGSGQIGSAVAPELTESDAPGRVGVETDALERGPRAESAPAGTRLHAASEEGIRFRQIAEANHVGFLGAFAPIDNPTSSAGTRR